MRDRFVICRNPDEAERDAAVRGQLLEQLGGADRGLRRAGTGGARRDRLQGARRSPASPASCGSRTKGLLRIDRAAVAAEAQLDGKFLLRTRDPTLSAEDVALGYKQLLEVERALAGHEDDARPAPRPPPQGGAHPRPRPAVLAVPAAHPARRDGHRRDLAHHPPGDGQAPPRAPRRSRRRGPPADRDDPPSGGHPQGPRRSPSRRASSASRPPRPPGPPDPRHRPARAHPGREHAHRYTRERERIPRTPRGYRDDRMWRDRRVAAVDHDR